MRHLVAQFLEPGERELLVLALGLLHREHVGVGSLQPIHDPIGTGTD